MNVVAAQPIRTTSWRALVVPREHGSWSLALEPLALALLAAPSWPGAALTVGAIALFLARRPWQAARVGDARIRPAALALAVLGTAAASTIGLGIRFSTGPSMLALLVGWPAAAAFAWFDRRKAGRETAAELAGTGFFAAFAAAIVLAAGRDPRDVIALSVFALARSWTSILSVRTLLRRRKSQTLSRWPSALVAVASILVFAAIVARDFRWVPAAWLVVFAVRTGWYLGPRAPTWTARRLGMLELVLGVLATVSSAISFR